MTIVLALWALTATVELRADYHVRTGIGDQARTVARATLAIRLDPRGGKTEHLTLETRDGEEARERQSVVREFYADGQLRHFRFRRWSKEGELSAEREVRLTAREALVTTRAGDREVRQRFPALSGPPQARESEFWFLRAAPARGTRDRFQRFHEFELRWITVDVIYSGRRQVTVGERTVWAHAIESSDGVARYVDDAGLPVLIVEEAQRYERDWSARD